MASDPPYGPVVSTEPTENITLVPFGAETLRTTCIPVIGTPNYISTAFTDDFTDGDQVGWINYTGSYYVSNGEYVCTNPEGGSDYKSIQTATLFSDFVYEAKMMQLNNRNNGGLVFRVSKASLGSDSYCGYYAGISAEGSAILGKSNGSWTEIKTAKLPINVNTWYNLKIIAKGNTIKFFVNDMSAPVIEVKDDSYTKGSIGVRAYEAQVKYDNISVKELSK